LVECGEGAHEKEAAGPLAEEMKSVMGASRSIRRVWVEADNCMAHGLCVNACPQVFHFPSERNHDGTLTVRITDNASQFFVSHADAIRYAEWACPVEAIRVEYE
jgi:ferredoxin